jgi:hypothetical protein
MFKVLFRSKGFMTWEHVSCELPTPPLLDLAFCIEKQGEKVGWKLQPLKCLQLFRLQIFHVRNTFLEVRGPGTWTLLVVRHPPFSSPHNSDKEEGGNVDRDL